MILKMLKSFYTKLSLIMALVMYFSYAIPTNGFKNGYLIFVSVFVFFFLPYFTKISEIVESFAFLKTGSAFAGKIARFLWQYLFNLFAITMLIKGDIVQTDRLDRVGGVFGAIALLSFASQGLQYIMMALANRNIGNMYLNITLALSINMCLGAIASLGYENVQVFYVIFGLIMGCIGALYSLYTDILGILPLKGGVGVFCGTFNPVHVTHMKILKNFIEKRDLEKVYLHSTVVPKLHQVFLEDGVIRIKEKKDGMRFYERTDKADFHINYFATGNAFYEAENRFAMLKAAVKDAGLEDKVEILFMPEVYEKKGFYGIIDYVKEHNKGKRIYGLHGSDGGGKMVRAIYDEKFIIPNVIRRTDNVSATAIRNGAKGMTAPTVDEIRKVLRDDYPKHDNESFVFNGDKYIYRKGLLIAEGANA
ncbi:hypothetical protein [uncultured Ruminococcus sp.]|uniref:hypothetical protein n=1 Tax=uncultured Ruminococcus sp. TaxID=165186 RepID=UPI002629F4B8|nr:hypothetical protein [uncultured Ruminococcus sp.]